jgi:broad specificity phosphatase PhoE
VALNTRRHRHSNTAHSTQAIGVTGQWKRRTIMRRYLYIAFTAIFGWTAAGPALAQSSNHHGHQQHGPAATHGHAHGGPGRHLSQETHALVSRLQAGGLVIFLRHERTELGKTRDEHARFDDCASQRNLSPAGMESAGSTGEAFRILRIPVGEVRASPICRTMDTARRAFGKATADEALLAVPGKAPRPFSAIAADLKKLIESLIDAPDKTNAVLVGHFHSPEALSGVFPEEGEAVVYERAPAGDIRVLGRLTAAAWTDVVHDLRRMGAIAEAKR